MYLLIASLFTTLPIAEDLSDQVENHSSSIPNFNTIKAIDYLESLYDFLKSIGGKELYSELRNKSEEERKEILEELSLKLSIIVQNIEARPGWCGGLGSIGLVGLFLSLENLLDEIPQIEGENVALKIFQFFQYMGCKSSVLSAFD